MSLRTLNPKNVPWRLLTISVGLLLLIGIGFAALRPRHGQPTQATEAVLSVPENQPGKVGTVTVTGEAMELAAIRTAPATERTVSETLAVSGVIQTGGDHFARVTPRGRGKVVKLLVTAGDPVRKGGVLALLESPELAQAQSAYRQAAARAGALEASLARQRELARLGQFGRPGVEEARTRTAEADRDRQAAARNLAEQQAELARATSRLEVSRTEMVVQRLRLKRSQSLRDLIADQDLERIRADYNNAIASVKLGSSDVASAKARVAAAERELFHADRRARNEHQSLGREERVYAGNYHTSRELVEAETSYKMARIEMDAAAEHVRLFGAVPGEGSTLEIAAPISGTVQDAKLTLGESVDPEDLAFTVIDLDRVWAQLAVSPKDLPSIKVGNPVELTAESSPGQIFRGRITHISPATDETTRAIYVRTALHNPRASLKSGTFVRGTIVTDVRHGKLAVPDGALQEHTGRPTLYVVPAGSAPGSFEVRHVTLGTRGHGWREISDGLKPGEVIAVNGTFYLKSEALKSSLADGCCAVPGR